VSQVITLLGGDIEVTGILLWRSLNWRFVEYAAFASREDGSGVANQHKHRRGRNLVREPVKKSSNWLPLQEPKILLKGFNAGGRNGRQPMYSFR
jgi:hypothetical protein